MYDCFCHFSDQVEDIIERATKNLRIEDGDGEDSDVTQSNAQPPAVHVPSPRFDFDSDLP